MGEVIGGVVERQVPDLAVLDPNVDDVTVRPDDLADVAVENADVVAVLERLHLVTSAEPQVVDLGYDRSDSAGRFEQGMGAGIEISNVRSMGRSHQHISAVTAMLPPVEHQLIP